MHSGELPAPLVQRATSPKYWSRSKSWYSTPAAGAIALSSSRNSLGWWRSMILLPASRFARASGSAQMPSVIRSRTTRWMVARSSVPYAVPISAGVPSTLTTVQPLIVSLRPCGTGTVPSTGCSCAAAQAHAASVRHTSRNTKATRRVSVAILIPLRSGQSRAQSSTASIMALYCGKQVSPSPRM